MQLRSANNVDSAMLLSTAGTGKQQAQVSKADEKRQFQQVLNQTMVATMLKEARKSSHKTPYFNGGHTEEVFGQQLDQEFAEKIGAKMAAPVGGASLANLAGLGRN